MNTIVLILFCIMLILNVIALVRHHMAVRMLNCALQSFLDQQRMLNEFMETERAKRKIQ